MAQRLGIDTYSLRSQGWDALRLLDYAASLGLQTIHFSERRFLGSLQPELLKELSARAEHLGVAIEIGMRSFDRFARSFDATLGTGERQLSDMLEAATIVGSPVVRCFLGDQRDRAERPIAEHVDECVRTLRAVGPLARERGVKIAVENHGGVDLLARELLELIERAGPDHVGACIDTGNPTYGGEDPLLTAEVLAPYAITSHVRDSAVWETDDGASAQWVPIGEGNVDLASIVALLAEKAPNCPVDVEVITGGGPKAIPFLDRAAEHWRLYPDVPARDFARFAALAREGTRRRLGPRDQLVSGGDQTPEQQAALRAQELRDFETSVTYCQKQLGLVRV